LTKLLTEAEWAAVAAEIDACRAALRECERAFGYSYDHGEYEEDERYSDAKGYLGYRLRQAHIRMLILLEHLQMPMMFVEYQKGFSTFSEKLDAVGHSSHDPEDLYSDPLIYISQNFEALSEMLRRPHDSDAHKLQLFEQILRQTPYILADQGLKPQSEKEVRKPLYDLLKTVFPDTQREIPVSHLFKTYRADIGSRQLKALVEVKYALDEAELRQELDGVYADINGYAGDDQWTRFFALFYTATPVAAPERMLEEFKLSRVDVSWTPIIVHGTGDRPKRLKTSASNTRVSKTRNTAEAPKKATSHGRAATATAIATSTSKSRKPDPKG
jgi:hypothetical protein